MKNKSVDLESVVVDLGNSLLKGMKQSRADTAFSIPHAVKRVHVSKLAEYTGRRSQGLGRGTDANIFQYEGHGYIIGEAAELGADTRRTGGAKYARDYYAPLLIAILLRLYPSGHDGLRIMAAFPPGDFRHVQALMQALGGKHVVTLSSGETVTFKIRQVQTYDEPVGGLWNYLLANDGLHYQRKINQRELGLCVDVGGKISSLVPFRADGWIDYTQSVSVDIGIQDVMKQVSDILLASPEYNAYFGNHRGSLPQDESMRECLTSGLYLTGGYELNVLDAITDATQAIRTRIKEVYDLQLGGARPYRYIIVTGGGGGLLYAQLVEHVLSFNPEKVYLSHNKPHQMHMANMFGGDKMLCAIETQV